MKNNIEWNFKITMSKIAAWYIVAIAPFQLEGIQILEAWFLGFLMLATKQAIDAYKTIKGDKDE
jgi:uncharacterized membrane protein YhdT